MALLLCDLDEARQLLDQDQDYTDRDPVLVNLIMEVSQAIEAHCNRHREWGFEQQGVTEYLDGGVSRLFLKHVPLSGTAPYFGIDLRVDTERAWGADTQLDDGDFTADRETGIIDCEYGKFLDGKKVVKVTYTGGYTRATLPKDLKLAAKVWIQSILDSNVHDWSAFVSSGGVMQVREEGVPGRVKKLLQPHVLMVGLS